MKFKFKTLIALLLIVASVCSTFSVNTVSVLAASNNVHDILFDWEYYYAANPDVAKAFGKNPSALRNHYNSYGKREGRAPSKLFDPKVYLSLYPDLRNAFGTNYVSAYNHFVSNGINESRQASSYFSVSVYKANYEDLRKAFGNNNLLYLKHYREYGERENRNAKTLLNHTTNATNQFTDVTKHFAGKKITFKSVENGKYLSADGNISKTPAVCNRTSASTWETFTVSNLTSDGWVGIKAYNGKWLTANKNTNNTPLQATASKLQSWECFRIYQKGNDYYIKAQANNKYLCVRVDTANSPVQAYASNASTWERFNICLSGVEQYISMAELTRTANDYGIGTNTNAYKALESINTKYANKLTATQKQGTNVFMFEGVGNNASSSKRMNAMCVVVKNGDIVYLNRNCSTIPDYPFNPAKNDNTAMPTLKSGIYTFSTVNHRGKYAALNVNNAQVVRFNSKTSYYNSTSSAINVHRRDSNDIASASAGWVNSAGCLLVGSSGTASSSEYAAFIKALGIVKSNATGTSKYSSFITGKIIVDRTYAQNYLKSVGYSNSAIQLLEK